MHIPIDTSQPFMSEIWTWGCGSYIMTLRIKAFDFDRHYEMIEGRCNANSNN
jgi:hypothetical protein